MPHPDHTLHLALAKAMARQHCDAKASAGEAVSPSDADDYSPEDFAAKLARTPLGRRVADAAAIANLRAAFREQLAACAAPVAAVEVAPTRSPKPWEGPEDDPLREFLDDAAEVELPPVVAPFEARVRAVLAEEARARKVDVVSRAVLAGWADVLTSSGVRNTRLTKVAREEPIDADETFAVWHAGADASILAVLVAPQSRRVFAAYRRKKSRSIVVGVPLRRDRVQPVGNGWLEAADLVTEVTGCMRTHTPDGVVAQKTGLGLLLYGSLALLASALKSEGAWAGRDCVCSADTGSDGRTPHAAGWWEGQVERGLAKRVDVTGLELRKPVTNVAMLTTRDVLKLGCVVAIDPVLERVASAWRQLPLDVLLAMRVDHIPDEDFLRVFVRLLEREGASDEQVARFLVDNGHGALLGVEAAPKRFVANRRDAFAKFYGSLVEVD